MTEKNTYQNIHEALAAAQGDLENPDKTKTAKAGSYSYKYADIADVLNVVRPILSKHGIALTQATAIEGDFLSIETSLSYPDGSSMNSVYPVCNIKNGDHQKIGSAMTYARRYALTSLIGIAAEDDDDGKNAAKTTGSAMSVHRAKQEINWDGIVESIRNAKTMKLLDNMTQRVNENDGVWPASYVTAAREEIEGRKREIDAEAAEQFEQRTDAELDEKAMEQ